MAAEQGKGAEKRRLTFGYIGVLFGNRVPYSILGWSSKKYMERFTRVTRRYWFRLCYEPCTNRRSRARPRAFYVHVTFVDGDMKQPVHS